MKNSKSIGLIAAVIVLTMPGLAMAGVDIHISVPLFGLFPVAPPPVIVAPAPYGYAAPYEGAVLYGGFWYRPAGGHWYVSAQAGGPWTVIGIERVPYAVLSGPVLMGRPHQYVVPRERPSYGYGWYGHGGYGRHRGHDDD